MRRMKSTPTPYWEINDLLAEWVTGVKGIAGGNVVGLYLSGSLACGDFVKNRSDIDLQAVLGAALTEPEIRSLEVLHKDLDHRYPAWAHRTECSYVASHLLQQLLPPKEPRPWWGFDKMYDRADAGNEWIINHYFLSKCGIALLGPEFHTLVPPIDLRQVKNASARDLFQEWVPKSGDSACLADSHCQSYLVLNVCRILHTVLDDGPASKRVAAEWVKASYPQWAALVDEAQRWEYGQLMSRAGETIAFVNFAADLVSRVHRYSRS